MKAIPMRGRLTGKKRIQGFIWAGQGRKWQKKENYFQLEDDKLISAAMATSAGQFWIKCHGATCNITLRATDGKVLGTFRAALPRGRK